MPKYQSQTKAFIEYVKTELAKTNTKLQLGPKDHVVHKADKDIRENWCRGYYDDANRLIAVATKIPEDQFVTTLAHEFGHYLQWASKYNFKGYDEAETDIVEYTTDWSITRERAWECVGELTRVELDAERRALDLIVEWGLPVDPVAYIKVAVAYLLSYPMIAHTRMWPNKRTYDCLEIVERMPEYQRMPKLKELPLFTTYEKLFYVYGVFDPPKKLYTLPSLTSMIP